MRKRLIKKIMSLVITSMVIISIVPFNADASTNIKKLAAWSGVKAIDKGSHYEIEMNYNSGKTHREMGQAYGREILKVAPDYEELMDSYLNQVYKFTYFGGSEYEILMERVNDIKPQIQQEYKDEIEGLASVLSGDKDSRPGDGKIGENELYIINLLIDVIRGTQCSAVSVFGDRSETDYPIAARNLDWYEGVNNEVDKLQCVVTYRNGDKSFCNIGYLGYFGIITGFNDNGLFSGILDIGDGERYDSKGKRSYPFDIRYALENYDNVNDAGAYLTSKENKYTFSHSIMLSDKKESKVVENNMKYSEARKIRRDNSKLNDGTEWGIDNAVGVVNSFILEGCGSDNISNIFNAGRWDNMKKELKSKGNKVSREELKEVASYKTGSMPGEGITGDLYNVNTCQSVIFEPENLNLEIFFKDKDGKLQAKPNYEKVHVWF